MIIDNNEYAKLTIYSTGFFQHLITDSQPLPKQQSWNPEITNFAKFLKTFELPDKRGSELTETRRKDRFPPPSQPQFLN